MAINATFYDVDLYYLKWLIVHGYYEGTWVWVLCMKNRVLFLLCIILIIWFIIMS